VSELALLRQRKELVLLSADLQRATITRRLERIRTNPMRQAIGAVASTLKRPMVWRLGSTAVAFALRAYRQSRRRRR
jgi:hypothetical protein